MAGMTKELVNECVSHWSVADGMGCLVSLGLGLVGGSGIPPVKLADLDHSVQFCYLDMSMFRAMLPDARL